MEVKLVINSKAYFEIIINVLFVKTVISLLKTFFSKIINNFDFVIFPPWLLKC